MPYKRHINYNVSKPINTNEKVENICRAVLNKNLSNADEFENDLMIPALINVVQKYR